MKFIDYIRGKRHGKKANRLERNAMTDPFLQDAIDGYDSMEGDYIADIKLLEKRLQQRVQLLNQHRQNRRRNWSIAAVLALLTIGIGSLIYFNFPKNDSTTVIPIAETDTGLQQTNMQDSSWLAGTDKPSDSFDFEAPPPVILHDNLLAVNDEELLLKEEEINTIPVVWENIEMPSAVMTEAIAFEDVAEESVMDLSFEIPEETQLKKQKESDKTEFQGAIFGFVREMKTGNPIPLADISIISQNAIVARFATDFYGNYKINAITAGSYTLRFSSIGYQTLEFFNVTVPAGRSILKNVEMQTQVETLATMEISEQPRQWESTQINAVQVRMDESGKMSSRRQNEFGEKEFSKYFEKNIPKDICKGQKIAVQVSFYLPESGIPENIKIEQPDCDELQEVIVEILRECPPWTETQRNVKMTLRVQ